MISITGIQLLFHLPNICLSFFFEIAKTSSTQLDAAIRLCELYVILVLPEFYLHILSNHLQLYKQQQNLQERK